MEESLKYIQGLIETPVETGIILGTGLGGFIERLDVIKAIPYTDIPGFPRSTVEGHYGQLILGKVKGKKVLALQGRFHFYEGYPMSQVVLPIRVLHKLGVKRLILSNASGGVHPDMRVGDIMIIRDHINLQPDNPLRGTNDEDLGPRFPDMSQPYDSAFIQKFKDIAQERSERVLDGVYAAVPGPNYETPAEYKMIRILGADAVGMSTVPEVIAAVHMGMKCFGITVITDLGVEGKIQEITHEEVQLEAQKTEKRLGPMVEDLVERIS
jgi:purine-nucleoside phosphorylase